MGENQRGGSLDVVDRRVRQAAGRRDVADERHDPRVVRIERRLAARRAKDFDLGDRIALEPKNGSWPI